MGGTGDLVMGFGEHTRSDWGTPRNSESFSPDAPPLPFSLLQTETKVEPYEVYNPVPLIVGSSAGGLLLLALITGGLYKVSPPGPSSCPSPPPTPTASHSAAPSWVQLPAVPRAAHRASVSSAVK